MRIRFATAFSAMMVSIVLVGIGFAGEPVKSGLSIGESVSPFDVEDVTGPNKGRSLCYR